MEPTTALLIAIPVLVLLAGVLVFATARRRDTGEAIGALARETRKRDRGAVAVLEEDSAPVTGREVERAAVMERREASKALATVGATTPRSSASPAGSSSTGASSRSSASACPASVLPAWPSSGRRPAWGSAR
jgi:Sec-independent protein translocase protein TatA